MKTFYFYDFCLLLQIRIYKSVSQREIMVELIPYDMNNYTNLIKTSPRFPVNAPSISSSVFASCKILFIGCYNAE